MYNNKENTPTNICIQKLDTESTKIKENIMDPNLIKKIYFNS